MKQDNRIVTNIKQVIKNKAERAKATFIYSKEGGYWMHQGCRVKPQHFDIMLPIEPVSYPVYL